MAWTHVASLLDASSRSTASAPQPSEHGGSTVVATGSAVHSDTDPTAGELLHPAASGEAKVSDGRVFPETRHVLKERYGAAPAFSITLLVTTCLTDLAAFIRDERELFQTRTRRVVITGNVDAVTAHVADEGGGAGGGAGGSGSERSSLRPDETSPSFRLDYRAATDVFRACLELGVQLVVLSGAASAAAPLPAFVHDELASSGHPVGRRLRAMQRASMEALWQRSRSSPAERARFSQSFCGSADLSAVSDAGRIWPHVAEFCARDALALLACHPATLEAFDVTPCVVDGVDHLVIGTGAQLGASGVRDCARVRSFLLNSCRHALHSSLGTHSAARRPTRPHVFSAS